MNAAAFGTHSGGQGLEQQGWREGFANLRGWAGLQRCDKRAAVHARLVSVRHALDAREQLVRVALRELAHRRSQHSGRRRHGLACACGGGGDAPLNCGCDLNASPHFRCPRSGRSTSKQNGRPQQRLCSGACRRAVAGPDARYVHCLNTTRGRCQAPSHHRSLCGIIRRTPFCSRVCCVAPDRIFPHTSPLRRSYERNRAHTRQRPPQPPKGLGTKRLRLRWQTACTVDWRGEFSVFRVRHAPPAAARERHTG